MTLNDPDLMVREWLEKIYRLAGPGADMAKAAIDLLDEQGDAVAELDALGEKLGDFDDATKGLELLARIEEEFEEHDIFREMPGEDIPEQLVTIRESFSLLEQQSFALQELCVEAGLLARNDRVTDPLPLLRMFLPI